MSSTGSRRRSAATPSWLEIAVPAGPEAVEAVSEILERVGYNGIAVEVPEDRDAEHVVKAYVPNDHVAKSRVRRVRDALGHLQAFGLGPVGDMRLRRVEDEDWLESWKASFSPLRVGAFLLRASWMPSGAGDAIELVLDPGMAFGTGLHPTTQQCLETLSGLDLAGRTVLDVGTGSGILAVAAAKRGARSVVAVDTDELAVRAARAAAAANDVPIDVRAGSAADVGGEFDLVIANIIASALRAIAPTLLERVAPDGTLILAGIVAEAEADVAGAFRPLRVGSRDQRDVWVRLTMRR